MGGSLHSRTHVHVHVVVFLESSISCLMCRCAACVVCFSGCHGGEQRAEGKQEGSVGEGLEKEEEDTSVGESTTSTVHVDAEFCNA